jgi:hypothetical protein
MNVPETFVARWLRLKQGAGEKEVAAPAAQALPAAFDPLTLPPVESITAASDIRNFLQPGVPLDLMRAALRTAWAADPAVRDFIGVAECQWDFNDPEAMPGFGPLGAAENAASTLAFALSRFSQVPDAPVPDTGVADRAISDPAPVRLAQATAEVLPGISRADESKVPQERATAPSDAPAIATTGRRHGSALPKLL